MPDADYQKAWAARNKDKVKAAQQRYREKNKEAIKERALQRRAARLDEIRERDREAYHRRFKADPERIREQTRKQKIKRLYGITAEEYDAMLTAQGNVCGSCGGSQIGSKYANWHVDHCHTTKRVRGILCHHCNVIVGMAGECPDKLDKIITYIKRNHHHENV